MRKRGLLYGVGLNDSEQNCCINGKHTPLYSLWSSMLMRCYSPSYVEKHKTYSEVVVCDSWKSLKNFENDIKLVPNYDMWIQDNWYLDKDLFSNGGKVYSIDTCCFLPPVINSFISNKKCKSNNLPTGVTWHKRNERYQVDIKFDGKSVYLGSFKTLSDAIMCYEENRKYKLKFLISRYDKVLDKKTKDRLEMLK